MLNEENNAQPDTDDDSRLPSHNLLLLSLLSTLTYLIVALLLFRFVHQKSLLTAFDHGYTTSFQLLIGILSGAIAAGLIGFIIKRPPVADVLNDFYIVKIISKMKLTHFDRIQLSAFAGTGEELLFRGAIQPLLGIWITSAIFIGIHGYFKFTSIAHIIFGLMMFSLSMMLGYLFEHAGLIAAMSAHAVYDVIMLRMVQTKK
ncbi:CPBP family intramembrane glutamic endopeptidase [Fodinibius sp. SL11]|uniref:CPBP family intramembrane glutamic endopeptidase n=1 Tax=Fodinibius sp. SL11 TaxID=3425690 RepID=UPI003F88166B